MCRAGGSQFTQSRKLQTLPRLRLMQNGLQCSSSPLNRGFNALCLQILSSSWCVCVCVCVCVCSFLSTYMVSRKPGPWCEPSRPGVFCLCVGPRQWNWTQHSFWDPAGGSHIWCYLELNPSDFGYCSVNYCPCLVQAF